MELRHIGLNDCSKIKCQHLTTACLISYTIFLNIHDGVCQYYSILESPYSAF
jgi:hypothetical protein